MASTTRRAPADRVPKVRAAASRRIAIIGPDLAAIARLRGDLIQALTAARHQVHCFAPQLTSDGVLEVEARGARAYPIEGVMAAPSLRADRRCELQLALRIKEVEPSIAIVHSARMLAIGTTAARRAGVARVIGMVTELTTSWVDGNGRPGFADRWRWLAVARSCDALIAHNKDHASALRRHRLAPERLPIHVLPGAGVDLERFPALPLPPLDRGLLFVMIARLGPEEGAGEFIEAARRVQARSTGARFMLAGPRPPDAEARLPSLARLPVGLEVLGDQADVRPLLQKAHVFVLPSWGEGMPRAVLEAMAAGRPIVTTNVPGCRETVDERVNGVLVPPRDALALAVAMESFLRRPDLIPFMARASRLKAERRFDVRNVNAEMMRILQLQE